ncbi:oxidoreductase [Tribonema minus]|uniref:Oxidoreductase n=1 Tax=Tribonema minus TaxID=303371 RepID=A0A835YNH2_9STRA|nr:oxidoreductase [Tribonema minus]
MAAATRPLAGKIALVTGSTDGIGRHTATKLATDGATVLVHGRNQERLAKAVEGVKKQSSNDQVHGILADISTLAGMRTLSTAVHQHTSVLDILVSNAGIFESCRRTTEDGTELVFATNVLAPFVTTGLLLPLLRASAAARVITVSSMSQGYAAGLVDPQFERDGGSAFSDHRSYSLSKLCDAMLSMEFHERFASPTLTFNTLDPGTVNTKMLDAGWGMCGIAVNRANDQYTLATSENLKGVSGKYFISARETRANPACYDPVARKQLWDYCAKVSGFDY